MEDVVNLFRVKKFNPMWKHNSVLKDIYAREVNSFVCLSGRIGGKTINTIQLIALTSLDQPQFDIVVLRANSSQLMQSIFIELKKFFFAILDIEKFARIKFKKSAPLMITLPAGNQIIFGGVGMGSKSGSNQSRGKTSERKLSLIVMEETQEIFSGSSDGQELLKQAMATYIRELDVDNGKMVYLGNRDRNLNGKFNVWAREKENDKTFLTIETNWHDVQPLLTRPTINMIEQERELNPNNYKYMFLGIPVGGNELVYGAFTYGVHAMPPKDKENPNNDTFIDINTKKEYKFTPEWLVMHLEKVYFGVDGSTTRDDTVVIPIFHMKDGKLIVKCGDILQHNPKMNGQIRNNVFANVYVRKWLQDLIKKYRLDYKEKIFIVDGINTDLIEQLQYQFGGYCRVIPFTKKDLVATSDRVNNALTDKLLLFTDESWVELVSKVVIQPVALYNELETVCWREDDPTKFNDAIPNDKTDGIRYPVAYHAAPYQLHDYSKGSE